MGARVTSRKKPSAPALTGKSADKRKAEAYERLGVAEPDVLRLPQISHILSQLLNGRKGGVLKAIEFLRGADNADARKWLAVYDSIPESARKLLPFEAFCLASGLTTKRMLEVVTGACFEQSANASSLVAAAAHPAVVTATVKGALRREGEQDRKMIHQHMKFLPVPKNSTTIINPGGVQNNLQDNSQNLSIGVQEVQGLESKMGRIANRFNERLGLPASAEPIPDDEGAEAAEPIAAEPEALDAEFVPDHPSDEWA